MDYNRFNSIFEKDNPSTVELASVVEGYIKDRTGKEVKVDQMRAAPLPFFLDNDFKMYQAYLTAKRWYEDRQQDARKDSDKKDGREGDKKERV